MMMSPVIAGCMNWGQWGARFSKEDYHTLISQCIDIGVTTFDHADIYGHYTTEAEFGEALKNRSSLRSKMQIITKCGIRLVTPNRPENLIKSYDTSAEYIRLSVEKSLSNLNTDHVDCLLIHRPDPLMNPAEILQVAGELKSEGKILHFGVSNFLPQHMAMFGESWNIEINQFEISAFRPEPLFDGTLDYCLSHGVRCLSWSPLGGGKLQAEDPDESTRRVIAVAGILGEKYNLSQDQVLISWLNTHPAGIIPVLGTTKISRITSALAATEKKLTREEWFMVLRAQLGSEVP